MGKILRIKDLGHLQHPGLRNHCLGLAATAVGFGVQLLGIGSVVGIERRTHAGGLEWSRELTWRPARAMFI